MLNIVVVNIAILLFVKAEPKYSSATEERPHQVQHPVLSPLHRTFYDCLYSSYYYNCELNVVNVPQKDLDDTSSPTLSSNGLNVYGKEGINIHFCGVNRSIKHIFILFICIMHFITINKSISLFQLLLLFELSIISLSVAETMQKLIGNGVGSDNSYGESVAIDGEYLIVGAKTDSDVAHYAGSAYIFHFNATDNSWIQSAELWANDGQEQDRLGGSVAISGKNTLIGAQLTYDSVNGYYSGAAYIFTLNHTDGSWKQTAKLTASDAAAGDYFGHSVDLSGDYAAIGAYQDGGDKGSVYIFKNTNGTWIETAKIMTSDTQVTWFGNQVAIDGRHAVIGVNYGDSAFVFERYGESWLEIQKLTGEGTNTFGNTFGRSVGISGGYIIVGDWGDDTTARDAGAAYIFENISGSWQQVAKLLSNDGAEQDYCGDVNTVGIYDDGTFGHAIVGCRLDDDMGLYSGSAYLFNNVNGSWTQREKFIASDGYTRDYFGEAVSISTNGAVIGAPGRDAVYVLNNYDYCNNTPTQIINKEYRIQWELQICYSASPTTVPTTAPTRTPSQLPSNAPTLSTDDPTVGPTVDPTSDPTPDPTIDPTMHPTVEPTLNPTYKPTMEPTLYPTRYPTTTPTLLPTVEPTVNPTFVPTLPSNAPSMPTINPTYHPSLGPNKAVSTEWSVESDDGGDKNSGSKAARIVVSIIVTLISLCCSLIVICLCVQLWSAFVSSF